MQQLQYLGHDEKAEATISRQSRSIVIPTWTGHKDDATFLVQSIRASQSRHIDIYLVISEVERPLFAQLAQTFRCSIFTIEELVKGYCGKTISGDQLLKMIDRYRFQSLKKFLALARLEGLALLIDSESRIARDLGPIFEGGLQETTVLYSKRPWDRMPAGLAKDAFEESCYLLGRQPFWFFESLNWLYSTDLVRELLDDLKAQHGIRWMFRRKQLFESQVYFQYARQRGAPYRFIRAEDVLADHFGTKRATEILESMYASPWKAAGIFEYLARFVTRDEFVNFLSDENALQHFRLLRYEPYGFYDVVGQVRQRIQRSKHFFGEAAMHRGPLVNGKTAVLLCGDLLVEQDIYNVQAFLAGVDCDVFIAVPQCNWLMSLAEDVLNPVGSANIVVSPPDARTRSLLNLGRRASLDRAPLDGVAMSSLINAAYSEMADYETKTAARYSTLVCLRPQMSSSRHLRDILWDASENTNSFASKIFVPNRFWCDGVNAHLLVGLRNPMGRLLQAFEARVVPEGSTVERILAKVILEDGLIPVPFPLQYVLVDGSYPDLKHVTRRYKAQSSGRWTGTITAKTWSDASHFLRERTMLSFKPPRNHRVLSSLKWAMRQPIKRLEQFIKSLRVGRNVRAG